MCDCKTPAEHAAHLRQEAAMRDLLFPRPVEYFVILTPGELEEMRDHPVLGLAIEQGRMFDQGNRYSIQLSREEWRDYVVSRQGNLGHE